MVRAASVGINGTRLPLPRALKQPGVRLEGLVACGDVRLDVVAGSADVDVASVETEFKYEGYLRRQMAAVERQRQQEWRSIPANFAFEGVPGLSTEMVERLSQVRPATLGHASRIPGVTPAAIAVIAACIGRKQPSPSV
jgi:tRNA uridine 5-carboxymethylaminomethyl modification enzyme